MTEDKKPWGGRFKESTDELVEAFTASIHFDKRLYRYDIEGSIAHCRMLARQKIITAGEKEQIVDGLTAILRDIEEGSFQFSQAQEDVHMAIEKALIERIGDAGGKLHTGRSRNDQVSLDTRLYLRDEIDAIVALIIALKQVIVDMAKRHVEIIMPGYTHLQKAQPVLLSHYLLAFREMFDRDGQRFQECRRRVNVMPLGSAALAGTGIPLDRAYVADLLEFPALTENSMDAVSDRDFIAEFIFDAGLLMMHLSRFCEDLVIWSSDEFGYVEISDGFTTGSSIMPQKKNPDVAELIRGKTGRVYGNLAALMTVMKGLPMTYDRDLQEDKEPLFDTVDTIKATLAVFTAMVKKITFREERMREAALKGFSTATDVAEYLVRKGIPFREAHGIVGKIVLHCIESGRDIPSLTVEEMKAFHSRIDEDVFEWITVEQSVNARNIRGATARTMVLKRIEELENTDVS